MNKSKTSNFTYNNLVINPSVPQFSEVFKEAVKSPVLLDFVRQGGISEDMYHKSEGWNPKKPNEMILNRYGKEMLYHEEKWKQKGRPQGTFMKWLISELTKSDKISYIDENGFPTLAYLYTTIQFRHDKNQAYTGKGDEIVLELSDYGMKFFSYAATFLQITNKEIQALNSEINKKNYLSISNWYTIVKERAPKGTRWKPLQFSFSEDNYTYISKSSFNKSSIREKHFNSIKAFFNKIGYYFVWSYKNGCVNIIVGQKGNLVNLTGSTDILVSSFRFGSTKIQQQQQKDFTNMIKAMIGNEKQIIKDKNFDQKVEKLYLFLRGIK